METPTQKQITHFKIRKFTLVMIVNVKRNVYWTEPGWNIKKLDVYIWLSSINEDDILL